MPYINYKIKFKAIFLDGLKNNLHIEKNRYELS